ncbi:MAG: pyridoxamine 5'-phosphate oxidase family protein [Sphingorhabdus sp.]
MTKEQEITEKFWKALKSDMTMFLGLAEGADGHARPMTAQLDDRYFQDNNYSGPIWFFTSTDSELYQKIGSGARAMAHFTSKGHDVWATLHGNLTQSRDRDFVDQLWNRFVAAWFDGGKDDPKLALIRFDPDDAEIWIDASSIVAGVKMLLGINPKQDYKDKVAEVTL